jgi:hypothetical protein
MHKISNVNGDLHQAGVLSKALQQQRQGRLKARTRREVDLLQSFDVRKNLCQRRKVSLAEIISCSAEDSQTCVLRQSGHLHTTYSTSAPRKLQSCPNPRDQ